MVHTSTLTITTDGDHLTSGGFSFDEPIRFGSMEFIFDCFVSLSLSPKGSGSGAVFMGMAHSGSPSLRTILEDFADELYMTSSGEGSSDFPISRRRSMGTMPTPLATTPWSEDAPATQTMAIDPPHTIMPLPDTGLPPDRWHTYWEGQ
jgi:hypothetical protein